LLNVSSKEIINKIATIQQCWADNVINIGKAYLEKKDYVTITKTFIDELYFFKKGKILFKPTKASHKQFRKTKDEFISYFIGYNKVSLEDKGFALEPWKNIEYNNFDFAKFENVLISMGNYIFTDYKENKTKVEYSFGYMLDQDENKLKIIFHHSSLPFNNN
tara:strand:- start:25 stop:510 length:486 start_codon:yes stop_codon:yes gene_type:complete